MDLSQATDEELAAELIRRGYQITPRTGKALAAMVNSVMRQLGVNTKANAVLPDGSMPQKGVKSV